MTAPRKARSGMIAPVRVTPEEERAIHAAAKALGMSVPDAVRAIPFLVRAVAGLRAELAEAKARAGSTGELSTGPASGVGPR